MQAHGSALSAYRRSCVGQIGTLTNSVGCVVLYENLLSISRLDLSFMVQRTVTIDMVRRLANFKRGGYSHDDNLDNLSKL
jgi:hypothetical protein